MGNGRRASWFDASQVFADTQRVDLFDDPAWETSPAAVDARERDTGPSRWATLKASVAGWTLLKRGQHSHKLA